MSKNAKKTETVTFVQGKKDVAKKVTVKIPKGYKRTNMTSHGAPVYTNGKDYIFPDKDGHNGGVWKKAKNKKLLDKKETRAGTYDENLNRIGD